jgi:hypothetical protein
MWLNIVKDGIRISNQITYFFLRNKLVKVFRAELVGTVEVKLHIFEISA